MEKKRVADLIDVERDLLSHGVTAIYAGVGAGKNSFVEGYHDGDVDYEGLSEKYKVLLITSRKAKVLETKANTDNFLTDLRWFPNIDFEEIEKINQSIVCTNSHIQMIIEHEYTHNRQEAAFWERFDFVIVDEFHSLVTDATFASSSYHVRWLLDEIYKRHITGKDPSTDIIKPRIILMSGTPEPAWEIVRSLSANILDYRQTAINVKPKKITFLYYKTALQKILNVLKHDRKVAYYMCRFQNLFDLIEKALEAGLTENQIAVSVSDNKTNDKLHEKYPIIYANKERTENELTSNSQIPENILFFITNSKNKEGINIKSDIPLLVMENHYTVDMQQICGRIRNGQHECIVVMDAAQYDLDCEYIGEEEFWRSEAIHAANNHLVKIARDYGFHPDSDIGWYKEISDFVKYIESRTKYVRYNPFNNWFEMNKCYIQARKNYHYMVGQLEDYIDEQIAYKSSRLDAKDIDSYFKGIPIWFERVEPPTQFIDTYFQEHGYILGETQLTKEQKEQLHTDLQNFMKRYPYMDKKPCKQLGRVLENFGCAYKEVGRTEYGRILVYKKDATAS